MAKNVIIPTGMPTLRSRSFIDAPVLEASARSHQAALKRVVDKLTEIIRSLQGRTDLRPETPQIISDVSPMLYTKVVQALTKHSDHSVADYFDSKLDYEYDEKLKTLIIKCETNEHERMGQILVKLNYFLATADGFYPPGWAEKVELGGSPSKYSILPLNYSFITYKPFCVQP
jgi:hypothetical protein